MERKFKTGDKVRLVSDTMANIEMTVRGYASDLARNNPTVAPYMGDFQKHLNGKVVCDWRDKNDCPQSENYYEDELIKTN